MDWKEVASALNSAEWGLEDVEAMLKSVDLKHLGKNRAEVDVLTNRRDMLVAKVQRLTEEVNELNMEV